MNRANRTIWTSILLATLAARQAAGATQQPFLHPVFTDNMVVQRERPVPVWGWTTPGERVTVQIAGRSASGRADSEGKWRARVGSLRAGGPYTLTIAGPRTVTLGNVLVGDVWICSGQSNMSMGVGACENAEKEIAAADYPQIRLLTVPNVIRHEPQATFAGRWEACTTQSVGGFSGVGYFFGRELQQALNVPIGLIHTSWGGTIAEAWASREALATLPDFQGSLANVSAKVDSNPRNPNVPTVLYNGMVAPLVPFGVKGVIWYQGELNAGRAYQYRRLLPTLIQDWRDRFGVDDLPFLIVQLANFQQPKPEPAEDGWAELREAQLLTAQSVPKTGLAVAIDIGDARDIHPRNKQDVGKRLALQALRVAYRKKLVASGPVYKSMRQKGNALELKFDDVGGGLEAQGGGTLQGFAIAGEDRKFVWADARIEEDTIVVSSPRVLQPVAARYAWAINPVCNLVNKAGLPASPFRTDDWAGVTMNNR